MNFRFVKRTVGKYFFKLYLLSACWISRDISSGPLLQTKNALWGISLVSQHVHHHFDGSSPSCLFKVNLSLSLSLVLQGFVCTLLILFRSSSLFKINVFKPGGFFCVLFSCKAELLYRLRHLALLRGHAFLAQAAVFSVPTRACVGCDEVILTMTGFCS